MAGEEKVTPTVSKDFDLFGEEFSAPVAETEPSVADPTTSTTSEAVSSAEQVSPSVTASTGKVRREIDLGDGSGKQVFEADTADELLDKLTTAQEHATRKIRQQEFELKRTQRAKPEKDAAVKPAEIGQPKALTADELFTLGQELQTNPAAAFDKILQASTGMNAAQLRQIGTSHAQMEQARIVNEAETSFLSAHQGKDYLPTPDNARAIQKFLQDEKLPYTAANLEYAFQELSEGGLLDMPDSVVQNTPSEDEEEGKDQRIVVPQHTRRKPMSTGLKNGNGGARAIEQTPTKSGLNESEVEQLYRMPLEEARTFMLSKMRQASSGSRK